MSRVEPVRELWEWRGLLRSWLATLHGPDLAFRSRTEVGLTALWRTAAGWHLAYLLVSLGGALVVARSGADTPVAQAAADGGLLGVVALTLSLWWGGTVLGTAVWWSGVLRMRAQSPRPSRTPPLP